MVFSRYTGLTHSPTPLDRSAFASSATVACRLRTERAIKPQMGVSSLALNEDGVCALKAGNLQAAHELFSKARVVRCVVKLLRLRCGSRRRGARPDELCSLVPRAAR